MNANELSLILKEIVSKDIGYTTWTVSTPHLLKLVNKAVQDERQACIKICEDAAKYQKKYLNNHAWGVLETCAVAMQVRGGKDESI